MPTSTVTDEIKQTSLNSTRNVNLPAQGPELAIELMAVLGKHVYSPRMARV